MQLKFRFFTQYQSKHLNYIFQRLKIDIGAVFNVKMLEEVNYIKIFVRYVSETVAQNKIVSKKFYCLLITAIKFQSSKFNNFSYRKLIFNRKSSKFDHFLIK